MSKTVADQHPHLYHYTTGAGLRGILESQQLWATNIAYLNDADEHVGYFDFRLPHVFREALQTELNLAMNSAEGRRRIERLGGVKTVCERHLDTMVAAIKQCTLNFNEPFIFSFSSVPASGEENDGILSQWQGYGADGGYAIVFESSPFDALLTQECQRYSYQFAYWGDVEYYSRLPTHTPEHEETRANEAEVQKIARKSLFGVGPQEYEPLFMPISILACSHKHRGFKQESEVRIVAVLTKNAAEVDAQESRRRKSVCFFQRNGLFVPYLKLFDREAGEQKIALPIRKIVVGPHRDKMRRKESMEMLLKQLSIDAEVVVSEIPYIGR